MKLIKKSIFIFFIYVTFFILLLKFISLYYHKPSSIEQQFNSDSLNLFSSIPSSISKNVSNKIPIDSCPIPNYVQGQQYLHKNSLLKNFKCPDISSLVKVNNGYVYVQNGFKTCSYNCINRKNDFESYLSEWILFNSNKIVTPCSYFVVSCHNKLNKVQEQIIITTAYNKTFIDAANEKQKTTLQQSYRDVMIVGVDSLSYQAWKHYLPKTYDVLHNDLKGVSFSKFNTLGDGTTVNLQGMLTGTKDTETYETRKRIAGSKTVDNYKWIWREYKNKGFITLYQEDMTNYGTFQYRLNGFKDQPTDYYVRTGLIHAESKFVKDNCLGNELYEKVELDLLKEFYQLYTDVPTFTFTFLGWMSHDDNKYVSYLDDHFSQFLTEQRKKFPNKIIVLYSDHGHRFNSRLTMEGKYEERLPFMGISLPDSMSKEREILEANSKTLVSGFDLHATLEDFIGSYTPSLKPTKSRHLSLIRPIPKDRTCEHVQLPPHWCSCLNWDEIPNPNSKTDIYQAAQNAVEQISQMTQPLRHLCAPLKLRRVHSALAMRANSAVLAFKQSSDVDGFKPDLSDSMRQERLPVRLTLETSPGDAMFELTVLFTSKTKDNIKIDRINYKDLSRINKYAPWIKCLTNYTPDVSLLNRQNTTSQISDFRKICICSNVIHN